MNFIKIFSYIFITIIMTELTTAQDWADLQRFEEDNNLIGLPSDNENRIVFMGNSITEGWSNFCPEFFEGKPYVNRGISGQTTPQMLLRFRQDVINLKPKVVVILAGTNDIAGNTGPSTLQMIMDNIISMSELAKANGIEVILSSVIPAYDYPWSAGKNPNEKIPALNKMIKEYTNDNNLVYIDYFTKMADSKNGLIEKYTYDGVHPNKLGYEVMAPLTEEALRKVLK